MLVVERSSEMGLFRRLFNHVFRNPYVQKYINHQGHLFFENVKNLILILKLQKKVQKIIFLSEINASQFVSLNSLY